jgi:hypothetical protein
MSKIDTWFNKIDQLFLLSPSFYTIFSGALIGAAINLLTAVIFSKEILVDQKIIIFLAILFLLASSVLFVYISLALEQLRSEARDIRYLLDMLFDQRRKLWTSAFVGFACVIIGIIILCSAMIY